MKRLVGLLTILACCGPAQAMTFSLPATSNQFLVERESTPSLAASEPPHYNPALAAGLSYLPGLATGVLVSVGQPPGTSLWDRLLICTGFTLFNPFCGLGQTYDNEPTRGFYFLEGSVLASIAAYTVGLASGIAGVRDTTSALTVGGVLLIPAGISAWAAYDAYHLAEEKNAAAAKLTTPEPK